MSMQVPFMEHRVPTGGGNVYVREFAGAGPAFVLMHGLPDNLHIYDELIPHLLAAGRRVIAFDFLGFGSSDKPGSGYDFDQQMGDLEAVVNTLDVDRFVPVAHDSSGPTAVNFALAHPERVAALHILNSAYDDAFPVHWPELVELFATEKLSALATAIAQDPAQFGWLLLWQQRKFHDALPDQLQSRFEALTGPLIADNFLQSPSAGPAFAQLAARFYAQLASNTKRLPELAALETPVKVIWGEYDPYFPIEMGKDRAAYFRNGIFRALPGGHWLQTDVPAEVAQEMLA